MCCYGQLVTNLMQLDLSVFVLNLFSSVQSFSHIGLFAMRLTAACQASLSITNYQSLLNSCPSTWWCHPTISSCLPLLFLPSIFPNIRVFSNESVLPIRWANNWSFNFSMFFQWKFRTDVFRMHWFDLLAVQGNLKSLFQHHSSKGIYVCHLSVTSYYPCWDLTTKTEFKQCAKMSVKTQWPIYTHLETRRGSCCIQRTVIDRSQAGIGTWESWMSH